MTITYEDCHYDDLWLDRELTVEEMTDDEKIDFIAQRVLKKYRRAFEELAK